MKIQVCIIGGGPSGLLLSQLLHLQGIDTIVLEKYSRDHVLARIRAGVLEHGFAKLMREAQCGERMDREGEVNHVPDGLEVERIKHRMPDELAVFLGDDVPAVLRPRKLGDLCPGTQLV